MDFDRRRLFALSATAAAASAPVTPTVAAPRGNSVTFLGVDATHYGVRPDSSQDQSRQLQGAIERAVAASVPLVLPPGTYRVSGLRLPSGTRLIGVSGASRLLLAGDGPLVSATDADNVSVCDLVLDGNHRSLPAGAGLIHVMRGRAIRIESCDIRGSGGHGIALERVEGDVARNTIAATADAALFSLDAAGLAVTGNTVREAGNNGILVWRSEPGDDGTLVVDNRIEQVAAQRGGSGQNGNAINIFRANNVIVRGNRIRAAAFSAVRGNAASNLEILGNSVSAIGEVALYAEFGFEGAIIAHNTVDGAAVGISVTNFNKGGRLAVVQGNLIRNLVLSRPAGTDPADAAGVGIAVEADTAVTGNVIEQASTAGILAGWGQYLRDVTVTANVVRRASVGIGVSVVPGAGAALVANNVIAETIHGGVVGMEWRRPATGDLNGDDSHRFPHLTIVSNQVR